MFCQLEVLRYCTPTSIRRVLQDLPESLDDTYERILRDILKANPDQAYRLLQFISVAERPLSVEELADILAVNFSEMADGIPVLNKDWRWEDRKRDVLTACSSLIVVENVDFYEMLPRQYTPVHFAHSSVKEFLTSDRLANISTDISRFHIRLEQAHTIIAQSCLAILLQSDHDLRTNGTFALYKYAAQHWIDHAHIGNVSLDSLHMKYGMRRLFDQTKPYFAAWLNLYDPDIEWWSFLRDFGSFPTWQQRPKFTSLGEDDAPFCLYYAALCGFRDLTGYLIAKYPQHVNATVGLNRSPLVAALSCKRIQVAELLRLHGAVLPLGHNGRTVLHAASADGLVDVVQWLLDVGEDANAQADIGGTPLHFAVIGGHTNIVQLLIEHGADVYAQDENQLTPLIYAKNAETMQLLIKYGADVRARDESQSTPLHLASSRDNAETVQLLIENGADVHARDESQSTPLHLASSSVNAETVRLLIENGADVHARDESESTPLHYAQNVETVRLLIKHGADVHARDENQSTPLYRVLSGKYDIISPKIISELIRQGADVNARDQCQSTPLHLASSSRDVEMTKLLIKHGSDINAQNQDQSTPLHIASSLSFSMNMGTIVRVLIEHGADVNALDKNHRTPLHRVASCWDPNSDCLRLLLEHGADVDVGDNKGLTALQIASSQGNGHHTITQLLLDHHFSMM